MNLEREKSRRLGSDADLDPVLTNEWDTTYRVGRRGHATYKSCA